MADYYWYGVKGAGLPSDISKASSSQTSTIELRVTYTSITEKIDALKALEAIKLKIEQESYPPA